MEPSNNQVVLSNRSELHKLIQVINQHITSEDGADVIVDKLVPPHILEMIAKFRPMLFMLPFSVPLPQDLLRNIFAQLAALDEEFWNELDFLIHQVLEGDEVAQTKVLQLIGVLPSGD